MIDRYISADSHVLEPADLWVERMDQSFRDQAPRIVLNPPGFEGEYWLFGDRPPVTAVQGFFAGASRDSYDEFPEHLRTARYAERLAGSYDPAARLPPSWPRRLLTPRTGRANIGPSRRARSRRVAHPADPSGTQW